MFWYDSLVTRYGSLHTRNYMCIASKKLASTCMPAPWFLWALSALCVPMFYVCGIEPMEATFQRFHWRVCNTFQIDLPSPFPRLEILQTWAKITAVKSLFSVCCFFFLSLRTIPIKHLNLLLGNTLSVMSKIRTKLSQNMIFFTNTNKFGSPINHSRWETDQFPTRS